MPLLADGRFELAKDLRSRRRQLVAEARARLQGPAEEPIARAIAPAPTAVASSTTSAEPHPPLELDPPVDVTAVRAGDAPGDGQPHPSRRPRGKRPGKELAPRAPVTAGEPSAEPARASGEVRAQRYAYIAAHAEDRLEDQAKALGMSVANVSAYRQRLADRGAIAIRRRGAFHTWTPADDALLRERLHTMPHEELARRIGTNLAGLVIRCKRLGISRREARRTNGDSLNGNDVARILGVDIHFVTHQAIAWGLLRARRSEWLHANGGSIAGAGGTMQWVVRRQDLVDFLIDHPWQYDRTRISDPFFRRVADEAWKRDPLYTSEQAARILGLDNQHGVTSLIRTTAPKFVPRAQLVVRRKGNPRETRPRSLTGMQALIPLSTLRAIQASGWVNYRAIAADPKRPTVDTAARLLHARAERPPFVTMAMLKERLRRFYAAGAIPTTPVRLGSRKPWMLARSFDDVLALKDALFARTTSSLRLTSARRAMIQRHDPSWLRRPQDLAIALADGRMATLFREWWDAEQVAARELRWTKARLWAFVTPTVARALEHIGGRTKYVGHRGTAYHRIPHVARLVRLPLDDARRRGIPQCEHCAFELRHRVVRPMREMPTCAECSTTFRRGPGRPPKVPLCARCRGRRPERRAA